ncbi:flagellar filament capping protein FliD [Thiomicrorhabdus sp. Kp2]|uniref:flagellar filament capping protein FliD n=1 Tax=Thiomicrorhabdus sp. Kp2 TaxID=1123518 RepID=UPI00041C1732|nr:flagellar filament capping protein FliD [Thiomicrorhabdus sp. Kp2]
MANEIGTTLLNSLTNSTFDIGNMAKVLAEAGVASPRATLETKETKANTELSALNYLQSNVEAFQSYLGNLSTPTLFQGRAVTSSDDSVISVQSNGVPVTGSYQVQSLQLAQAHTLVANKSYSSTSDIISMGTLSIGVGGQTQNIVIDNSNNTLEGLQNIINNGDYGVNASIINNGGNYQLMFSSKQAGAASEITLSGLADFDTNGFTTTSEAQDALMSINGLVVSNNSNTFDDVIDGLQISLKSVSLQSTQSLSVSSDSETISNTVLDFVDVYNQLDTILDDLGSYKELTEDEAASEDYAFFGDLAGSSLLRDLKGQIRDSLSGAISQLTDPNTLAAAGLSFDLEGKLSVDTTTLNNLITNNLDGLANVFAKSGQTTDPLMNVTGSSDKTQAGSYAVNISQLAEKATVVGGATTFAANEYRLAGGVVYDPVQALNIESGAGFQISINGGVATQVNFTQGSYATKDLVAAQIQSDINTQTGQAVSVAYDPSQGRFEITNTTGTVDVSSATLLGNQGFNSGSYASEQLMDLSGAAVSFDVSIDGSIATQATISAGKYTLNEFAERMRTSINNLSETSSSGASVSVSTEGGVFSVVSNRYGVSSDVTLSNFSNATNAGFSADLSDQGQNVDGTITTAAGTLSLGAYADSEDGRKIKISDYAVIASEPADVRGLEFQILGGTTGSRGDIVFSQGFASRVNETINNLLSDDNGLVSDRIDSLTNKLSDYEEKTTKLDARYETLLLKYQLQFSSLQSLLSSSQQTSDFLTATFSNNNNN